MNLYLRYVLRFLVQLSMREWDIPYDELKIGDRIGTGHFGTVHRGNWHGDVAIKMLNMSYPDDERTLDAFKTEVRYGIEFGALGGSSLPKIC